MYVYFSGYKIYSKDSNGFSEGVTNCVKNNIDFDIMSNWNENDKDFDLIGIRLKNTTERLNLVAVWQCKPSNIVSKKKWNDIFKFEHKNYKSLIVKDFNPITHIETASTDSNGDRQWEAAYNDYICD